MDSEHHDETNVSAWAVASQLGVLAGTGSCHAHGGCSPWQMSIKQPSQASGAVVEGVLIGIACTQPRQEFILNPRLVPVQK